MKMKKKYLELSVLRWRKRKRNLTERSRGKSDGGGRKRLATVPVNGHREPLRRWREVSEKINSAKRKKK